MLRCSRIWPKPGVNYLSRQVFAQMSWLLGSSSLRFTMCARLSETRVCVSRDA